MTAAAASAATLAPAATWDSKSLWILDYVGGGDDDGSDSGEEDMVDSIATVTLQVFASRSEATARVRQLITLDRAEAQAIEAEEDNDGDEAKEDDGASDQDGKDDGGSDNDDDGEDGDEDDYFDPPYPSVEEYGAYRITQVRLGEFYGWHAL